MKNINQVFADNLKKQRKRMGLSQLQLGEMLSYSEKSVSKWEAGKAIPDAEVLIKLSKIFGMTVDMLLTVTDAPFYYLGIDGGATKTEFWLEDENGNIVRTVQAESCNPIDIGMERAETVLERGIRETLGGIPAGMVSMFAGISGGTSAGYKEDLARFFEKFGFLHFENGSDLETAIAVALQERDGVIAIVGTGSVICSRVGERRSRIGGYGYLFDCGCCGYDLGLAGLQTAFRSLDMPQYRSLLTEEIIEKVGGDLKEHLSDFYAKGKKYIASFSVCVWDALQKGDTQAKGIVEKSVCSLAQQLDAALDQMPPCAEYPVALVGGHTRYEEIIRPILERAMQHKNQTIEFCKQRPVKGALLLARKEKTE